MSDPEGKRSYADWIGLRGGSWHQHISEDEWLALSRAQQRRELEKAELNWPQIKSHHVPKPTPISLLGKDVRQANLIVIEAEE